MSHEMKGYNRFQSCVMIAFILSAVINVDNCITLMFVGTLLNSSMVIFSVYSVMNATHKKSNY